MIKLKLAPRPTISRILCKISGMVSLLAVLTLCSCVASPELAREIPVSKEPPTDPYQEFLHNYRMKAIDHEGNGDFRKAILYWQVVACFDPRKEEALKAIQNLNESVKSASERHFNKGIEYIKSNLADAARKEFLLSLTYEPDHQRALAYIEQIGSEANYIVQETVEKDTPKTISKRVYNDPHLAFLITYFSGLDTKGRIEPGIRLKFPNLNDISVKRTKLSGADEKYQKAKLLFNKQKYHETISMAEEILGYDPAYGKAHELINASYYQLGIAFFRRKKYEEAQNLLRNVDPGYKNVQQILDYIERYFRIIADVHYQNGVKYFLQGKLDEALSEWNETLRLDPAHAKAKIYLHKAHRRMIKSTNRDPQSR